MNAERPEIASLIESLADGRAIDWPALEAQALDDAERRQYRNLRLVARLTELHRTLPLDPDEDLPAVPAPENPVEEEFDRWGHLEIRERIAGGSFGDVYLANDPQLDREVALKILKPQSSSRGAVGRLLAEARILARVRHENVVVVHGADVRDGRAGLWMELVRGQTLESWLATHGRMGPDESCVVGQALCRALAAVHSAGLVHGDVKAQNIVREDGGRVVLMDFGAGHAQGVRSAATTGTPLYLAPEVLAGAPATPQSDIFSVGVMLFHALTGSYPYPATTLDELRARHADGQRAMLRDVRPDAPEGVVRAVERALNADPMERFSSAGEMEAALTWCLQSSRVRHGRVTRAAMAAVLVTVVGVSAALWGRTGTTGAGAGPAATTLAVVPFVSDSEAPSDAELLDGLTTDVLRGLQHFNVETRRVSTGRPVAARPEEVSAMRVDAVVRGEQRGAGGARALRMTLVRAGGPLLWTRDYRIGERLPPTLARTIAGDIAKALGAPAPDRDLRVPGTPNPNAYDAYLRGRTLWEQRTPASLERSLQYFRESATLDAAYAEPWAGMADAYISLGVAAFGPLRPMEARRLAKEAALKALELEPSLAEAHTSLAFAAFFHDWDWRVAEERFKKAIELNPQYALAHHWYADYLNAMGRQREAMTEIERAQQLEPLSLIIDRDIAWHLFFQRRYAEAVSHLERTLARDPEYSAARTLLARALAEIDRHGDSLSHLRRAEPETRKGTHLTFVAYVQAKAGDLPAAAQTLHRIQRLRESEYIPPYNVALVYAAMHRGDDAIGELERAVEEQDPTAVNLRADPRLASLHDEPGFQRLLQRMRFPE